MTVRSLNDVGVRVPRSGSRAPSRRDAQRPHLAAGPARHRRCRRHERLRRRAVPPAGQCRHRGRDLHPRHLGEAAARRRDGARRHGPARRRRAVRGADQGRAARPAVHVRPRRACGPRRPTSRATTTSSTRTTGCRARSARWPATAGGCRWCTRCTRWRRSRTASSPTATLAEPAARLIGEEQVVEAADLIIANTDQEAAAADRAVRRRARTRAGDQPRRRSRRLRPGRQGGVPTSGSGSRPTRSW